MSRGIPGAEKSYHTMLKFCRKNLIKQGYYGPASAVYEVKALLTSVERGSNILYSLQTEELPTKSFVVL